MASQIGHQGPSISPNSSEEVDSHHATPATKLSQFSPDGAYDGVNSGNRGIIRSKVPPPFVLIQQAHSSPNKNQAASSSAGTQDPFLSDALYTATTRSSADTTKLSPVASTFTPASEPGSVSSNGGSASFDLPSTTIVHGVRKPGHGRLRAPPGLENVHCNTSVQTSNANSSPEDGLSPTSLPAGTSSNTSANISPPFEACFSWDDKTSRCLAISNIVAGTSVEDVKRIFTLKSFPSLSNILLGDLLHIGCVYIKCVDIRDTDKAFSGLQIFPLGWKAEHISPAKFALKHQPETFHSPQVSNFEGQIIVTVQYQGPQQDFDASSISSSMKELLSKVGELMAYANGPAMAPIASFRAEYYNSECVNAAVAKLDGLVIGSCVLKVSRYEPDIQTTAQAPPRNPGPIIIGQDDDQALSYGLGNMSVNIGQNPYATGNVHTPSSSANQPPTSVSYTDRKDNEGQHTPSRLTTVAPGFGTRGRLQSPIWSPSSTSNGQYVVQSPAYSSSNGQYIIQSPAYSIPNGQYFLQSPVYSPLSPGAIGQERGIPMLPRARDEWYSQQHFLKPTANGGQWDDYASAYHNIVDTERIRAGLDVRTTIMLRNIPNKIDQAMLKEIVDETSLGKYDFMYLRIDFANNCNVGYAFINFDDPYYIIEFVQARAGHRWNRFNSVKVAEVSYATIQGRDCLISKFRNSSVMLEHPSFRPKIFHTQTSPRAGKEDTFPPPDNPSKMRRSVENAEHVGLFAPRAGQTFRDAQRRRQSQFDRGTRLAMIEDAQPARRNYRNPPRLFRTPAPLGSLNGAFGPTYGAPTY